MTKAREARKASLPQSSFGLGWDASKLGESFNTNPYMPGEWRYTAWAEGWLRYRDSLIGKPQLKQVLEFGAGIKPLEGKPKDAKGK